MSDGRRDGIQTAEKGDPIVPPNRCVRITLELDNKTMKRLVAKANLALWVRWLADSKKTAPELDVAECLAWLVVLEARGETADGIKDATPPMWANSGLKVISEERRVYQDGEQLSGPTMTTSIFQAEGLETMSAQRRQEIVQFALGFLRCNIDDAFADLDELSTMLIDRPTEQELDSLTR